MDPLAEPTPGNPYRYSARFIRVWTRILCTILIVFPIAGIFLLTSSNSPDPQPVGMFLLVAGLVVPLLVGAVLGGNAIRRGGGWVGLLFFLGFAGAAAGLILANVGIMVAGFVVLVISGVGFWIIGAKSGVPMWLQLPMFGSPRLYVRGKADPEQGGDPSRDTVLPNKLDGRDPS